MVKIDRSDVMNSTPYMNKGRNAMTVIVWHETANKSVGADAYAHHRLQKNNPRAASWHYTVDDKVAVQSFPETFRLWHSGGVAIPYTIAIERCVNVDGDTEKSIENMIDLTVDIMKRRNITSNNVVTHYFYTGKNCPTELLSGTKKWTYEKAIDEVERRLKGTKKPAKKARQPKQNIKSTSQLANEVIQGKYGVGEERMKKLGTRYEEVQKEVNRILSGGIKKTVNYDDLVRRTLKGEFGNGETRKRKLGKYYDEVQRRINKKY